MVQICYYVDAMFFYFFMSLYITLWNTYVMPKKHVCADLLNSSHFFIIFLLNSYLNRSNNLFPSYFKSWLHIWSVAFRFLSSIKIIFTCFFCMCKPLFFMHLFCYYLVLPSQFFSIMSSIASPKIFAGSYFDISHTLF